MINLVCLFVVVYFTYKHSSDDQSPVRTVVVYSFDAVEVGVGDVHVFVHVVQR